MASDQPTPDGAEREAADRLLPVVYDELRRLARARLAHERPGQTLSPTGLVHEAYLRLVEGGDPGWANRAHFFAAAAESMRRILVENARRRGRVRHGGELRRTTLDQPIPGGAPLDEEVLAVDAALDRLEALDPEMAEVVKLRYFAGMSIEETADALGLAERTAVRRWTGARAWLRRELTGH